MDGERCGRHIAKFAIPCVISLLVNSLYNIVDQIFTGWGVGNAIVMVTVMGQVASFIFSVVYVFRFKSIHLSLSALRLNGKICQTILGLGISSFITQIAITIVMALTNNLLAAYGADSVYGSEIPLTATGIVMKVNQILISILVGISTGAQPIIGFNYGSKNYERVKKSFDIALIASEIVAVIAFLIFQFSPMTVVSLFGSEDMKENC